MNVQVVIPAYNAARTLRAVLDRIPGDFRERLERIWIVNDGSVDGTGALAESCARGEPRIRAVHLPVNSGYGFAVRTGILAARSAGASVVAVLHADGQYAPEMLPALVRALSENDGDLIQGSRVASGTALSGGMPLYKYVAGRALTHLENRVFGLGLTDYHSGYLVYGSRALAGLPFERLSDRFEFDLEVIACARARGFRIGELPIPTHYGDEISYLHPWTYGLRVLGVLWGYRRGRYSPASRGDVHHEPPIAVL